MSETDILNPRVTWDDTIQDNICPDYGFGVRLPNTRARAKAPGGQPVTRETQNTGRTLSLSWLNRSFACTQRIKHFYEQYEDGFFTIIDRDGGGRHYVGRFIGDFQRIQNGNDSYDVRDLTFEEVPGAPMLQYPGDWTNDSIALPAFNDGGQWQPGTSGTWAIGAASGFRTIYNTGEAGAWFTMEYRGYGFELWMLRGPDQGVIQVYLDNVLLGTTDLFYPSTITAQLIWRNSQVPLNLHRVKVLLTGSKNSASTAAGATFCKLQVMR